MRDEGHGEAEMKARGIAHGCRVVRQVRVNGEGRLYIGERGNDDPPDTLSSIERQDAVMAVDQPAHHLNLARGTKCGAAFLCLLNSDQAVDDLAPLHQQAVHGLIDVIDLGPQCCEREIGGRLIRHRRGLFSAMGRSGSWAAFLGQRYQSFQDMHAQQRRQVYAVCASLPALPGIRSWTG
jgi:hypothetical protein